MNDHDVQSMTQGDIADPVRKPRTAVPDGLVDSEKMGPIERANLASLLGRFEQRLSHIESGLTTKLRDDAPRGNPILELAKIIFGGWPAFGLLFLLLFYRPLRDAINAIPDKVKGAEEIGVLGVSLKTSLRVEAEKSGALQLSATLPTLSPAAVELLLRTLPAYNSLFSYSSDSGLIHTVWLPSDSALAVLAELESKKLIAITGPQTLSVNGLRDSIAAFRARYPGATVGSDRMDRVELNLNKPTKAAVPSYGWQLTELGKTAVNVVLKAVSAQLSPKPSGDASASK